MSFFNVWNYKRFVLLFCLNYSFSLFAQNSTQLDSISPVLVTNHTDNYHNKIIIKWLTDDLIYPLGVNIYRQEFGEILWEKINTKPLVKGIYTPTLDDYKADTTLKSYIEMAKTMQPIDLKEFVKIYVLVKSVQSSAFARYIGIQYDDSLITKDKVYRYKVIARTTKGDKILGYSNFIQVNRFIPDNPPLEVKITALDGKVYINWLPEDSRFYGVNIYRSSSKDSNLLRVNEIPLMISKQELPNGESKYPEVFFTDNKVENKVNYTYQIAGIDFFGRETKYSEKITVTPGDQTPPLAPYSLKCKVTLYDVKIKWANQFSPDGLGINIYRSAKRDNQYKKINSEILPLTDSVYFDYGLKPAFYYYVVASVDSVGNEGKSSKALVEVHDITPPATPQNLVAIADTGRIMLSWDRNMDEDLLGYQLYRTVNKDKQDFFVLLNAIPFAANTFTDTLPLNAKNLFLYKVVALDSALNRSKYSFAAKAKMPDVIPPVQPVIIGVNPKGEYLTVEWIPNRELDLAGYELFRSTNTTTDLVKVNSGLLSPLVTRYTDRTILPDSSYYYNLQAIDSTGNKSKLSQKYIGILPENVSNEPVSAINRFTAKKSLFSKSIKLQWVVDKSDKFIGFAIYRRNSPEDEPQQISNVILENSMVDSDKNPQTVQYQLRIYQSNGQVVKSEWIAK